MQCPEFPDKRQFVSKAHAKHALKNYSKSGISHLHAYKCRSCDAFHIGTKRTIIAKVNKWRWNWLDRD